MIHYHYLLQSPKETKQFLEKPLNCHKKINEYHSWWAFFPYISLLLDIITLKYVSDSINIYNIFICYPICNCFQEKYNDIRANYFTWPLTIFIWHLKCLYIMPCGLLLITFYNYWRRAPDVWISCLNCRIISHTPPHILFFI